MGRSDREWTSHCAAFLLRSVLATTSRFALSAGGPMTTEFPNRWTRRVAIIAIAICALTLAVWMLEPGTRTPTSSLAMIGILLVLLNMLRSQLDRSAWVRAFSERFRP